MTVSELKDKIKAKDLHGAYIFSGEEDYLKKFYAGQIKETVIEDSSFEVFNYVLFDGEEIDFSAVREAISAPPMFADYKLVEWRYADIDKTTEKEKQRLEELCDFISGYPYAVLVFVVTREGFDVGTAKRPTRLAARLGKCFSLVNFEKSTDAQLMGWLKRHFDASGISVTAASLSALIFRSGHSMQILKNEVDKLSAYIKANGSSELTVDIVEQVASTTLECDAFALSGAITDRRREAAYTALLDMKQRRLSSGEVLGMLCRVFGELVTVAMLLGEGMRRDDIEKYLKWNPYKIKICIASATAWGLQRLTQATERLLEMDGMSKSGGLSGFTPIELFIAEYL